MRQVIDGKVYDTETAEELGNYSNGLGNGDFRNMDESLYKTKKGAFFLSGSGGALTKYSEPCGNMTGGGTGILVLLKAEAMEWAEQNISADEIEKHFEVVEA